MTCAPRAARRAVAALDAYPLAVMEAASPLVGYDAAVFAIGQRGGVSLREGRLDDALRDLGQSIELARARGATEVLGWMLGSAALVWIFRGEPARAARLAREAMEIAERIESPLSRGFATGSLAQVLAQEGDLDGAIALAVLGVEIAARTSRPQLPFAMATLAEFRLQRGEHDEARRVANEALRVADTHGFQGGRLAAELTLARIALGSGESEAAASWLERAQRTIEMTGFLGRMPELLELRSEVARQRKDETGRDHALREALRLYQEMGATPHAERIARELAS